jgi:hypothetical protein
MDVAIDGVGGSRHGGELRTARGDERARHLREPAECTSTQHEKTQVPGTQMLGCGRRRGRTPQHEQVRAGPGGKCVAQQHRGHGDQGNGEHPEPRVRGGPIAERDGNGETHSDHRKVDAPVAVGPPEAVQTGERPGRRQQAGGDVARQPTNQDR